MSFISNRLIKGAQNPLLNMPVWAGGRLQSTVVWIVDSYNIFNGVLIPGVYEINLWGAGGGGQCRGDGWSISSPGGGGGAVFYTLTVAAPTAFSAIVGEKGTRPKGASSIGLGGSIGVGGRGYGKGGNGGSVGTFIGSGGGGSSSFITSAITLIAAGGGGAKPIRNTNCGVPATSAATAGGTDTGAGGFGGKNGSGGADGSAGGNGVNGGGGGGGSSNNVDPHICGPYDSFGGTSGSGGKGGSNVGGTGYAGSGKTPGNSTSGKYILYSLSAGIGGNAGSLTEDGSDGNDGAFIIEKKS